MQPREGFRGGSYRNKEKQIVWRVGGQNFRGKAQNNQREQGLERDSNVIDIDRGRGGIGHTIYIENGAI